MTTSWREVFADTAYWIALLDPRQTLHQIAAVASKQLSQSNLVTSDMVLTELLNYFAERGRFWRSKATQLTDQIQQNSRVHVEPQTRDLFNAGIKRYRERSDKGYSLTDCCSMVIMQRRGIQIALTSDHHFEQEGFSILLKKDR